jgi:aspartate aminotransferase-like enzyme
MTATVGSSTFGTFFLPGPTEVRPEVLAAMTRPMISHRGKTFEELFERLQAGLQPVFRTRRPVYISSSSATGLMEAAIRCAPDGPLLCLVGGAFGERFLRIAHACEREADAIEVPLGATFDLDVVETQLNARRYSALTVVHSESSTGVLTDIAAVAALARSRGVMSIVDSVTGLAAAPLETDGWELDFALTGSQKALALPPGLAMAVASPRFATAARQAHNRGMYFDLAEFEEFSAKRQTPNTPAIPLFFALEVQLQRIATEGIESRWERHARMRAHTEAWVHTTSARHPGLAMLAPRGSRSPSVSAITLPPGMEGKSFLRDVAAHGFTIGGGYASLGDRSFRIGHMGDHTVETLQRCLDACGQVLDDRARATGA